MIASLTGEVISEPLNTLVLDVNGVGYLIHATTRDCATLRLGSRCTLFTQLIVREDSLTLYGFLDAQSREFFELLQSVSGIGPKVALSALSLYSPHEISDAIANEETALLEKIPGLGKKGSSRLVLELKEKVTATRFTVRASSTAIAPWREQLLMALVGLGYSNRDAQNRVDSVAEDFPDATLSDLPVLLKAALAKGVKP